mmetsp:Transcript_6753/g.16474  ORF Transcript_6753/g.16474 Transcript_6753/m.16474 type:complete len:203 (+) Transcript_6753:727-1335(+)
MLRKLIDTSSGFGNQVILLIPQIFSALPSSAMDGQGWPCSAAGYSTSFQAKFLLTALSASSRESVLVVRNSGTASDSLLAGCVKDRPPARIRPNKSSSSGVTFTMALSVVAKQHTWSNGLKCCRTNASKADEASLPRRTTVCGDRATPRCPLGECLGDDAPPERSELGHISVESVAALRWRCGLKTWHINKMHRNRTSIAGP